MPDAGRTPWWRASEDAMTLVEVLVAILILGVILAGVAASLITSARASVTNERRVQSTAYLTSEHEDLQAIPWAQAALYEEEVGDLKDMASYPFLGDLDLDLDLDSVPPTFEGEPIATIPGPSLTGRLFFVPEPVSTGVQIGTDEREYDIVRVVSERPEGTKRFTTFVSWDVMGRTVTQRFDSERAPTPAELAELEREGVLQFLISPRPIEVDVDGIPDAGPTIVARFAEPMDSAVVTFLPPVDASNGEPQTITLSGDGILRHHSGDSRDVLFSNVDDLSEDAGSLDVAVTDADELIVLDAVGEWEVELVGDRSDGDDVVVTTTIEVEAAIDPELARPEVTSVEAVVGGSLTDPAGVGIFNLNPFRLCQSVEVTVGVEWNGLDPVGAAVIASYAGVTSQSVTMDTTDDQTYGATFLAGSLSPWLPPEGGQFMDRFWIVAVDADNRPSLLQSSNPLTFEHVAGECP